MRPTLTAISRYPVKSLRGESLDDATVEPWGLGGDRRWMVVGDRDRDGHGDSHGDSHGDGHGGEAITARQVKPMLLLRPRLVPGGLVVEAPGRADLEVSEPTGPAGRVTVHGEPLFAVPAGAAADAWFSDVLGRAARLVHLADPTVRTVSEFGRAGDRVSFADGYPVLLATEASLAALDGWIAEGPNAGMAPMPMARFRPNLVVTGTQAWEEDGWRRIRIGDAVFRSVKGCIRCVMTTIDPETAARGHEPIATLARHRRYDGATWFGTNLIPDTPGTVLHVGDDLEILEAITDPDGPPR